jgi:hypothetical protein
VFSGTSQKRPSFFTPSMAPLLHNCWIRLPEIPQRAAASDMVKYFIMLTSPRISRNHCTLFREIRQAFREISHAFREMNAAYT